MEDEFPKKFHSEFIKHLLLNNKVKFNVINSYDLLNFVPEDDIYWN